MRAVITGGSHGIGLAIKKQLEKQKIKVTDWSLETGWDLMNLGHIVCAEDCMKNYDILINNVGGMGTCKPEDANDCMKKNYGITMKLTRAFLKKKRKFGRVITISSIYGKEKGPNPYFTASKSAQIAFMKSLAGKYKGITFNTICPGYINTKKEIKRYANKVNAPIGKPEDVANLVKYLISNKANFIDGAVITCDGGYSKSF
jgi:3-oxoacyl-[acyl-carrier protein] reductase